MIHKKSTSLILGLLLLLSTFAGCKKVDPFSGEDNFILSFELSGTEGNAYKGTLSGDEITIRIPSNIARSSLSAKYTLSEMATVTPKPEEVKNWKNSQTFTVTSYSGVKRTYSVQIQTTDVQADNVVQLTTDEEVAQFATQGIDVINGNLIIGSNDTETTIEHIEGLSKLKEVRYNLIIYNNVKADLSPLFNSLERIGSLQFVGQNDNIETLDLPKLRVMPKGMSVTSSTLKSISMPALEEIGGFTIKCDNCATISMPVLKAIYGSFGLQSEMIEVLEFPELTTAQEMTISRTMELCKLVKFSMPKLATSGKISLFTVANLEEFNLPSLKVTDGLLLDNIQSLSALDLSNLESIQSLEFTSDWNGYYKNEVLKEINLPKLTTVDRINFAESTFGKLEALRMPCLKNLEIIYLPKGLITYEAPLLEKVLWLTMRDYLPSMVEHLKEVGTLQIDLSQNKEEIELIDISSIASLKSVTIDPCTLRRVIFPQKVEGEIVLNYNSRPAKIAPKMEGLVECGNFKIQYPSDIYDIEFPETLKTINGELVVSNSIRKVTAKGLVKAGGVNIGNSNTEYVDMPLLETISGTMNLQAKNLKDANFPKLNDVNSLLIGSNGSWNANTQLTNINFLSSLQKIQSIKITYCRSLLDYTGIKQLVENGQINESNWTSSKVNNNLYNPTYQDLKAGRYKLQ